MIKVFNPFTGTFDFVASDAEVAVYDARYLKLNQSTPQVVAGKLISGTFTPYDSRYVVNGYKRVTIGDQLITNSEFYSADHWTFETYAGVGWSHVFNNPYSHYARYQYTGSEVYLTHDGAYYQYGVTYRLNIYVDSMVGNVTLTPYIGDRDGAPITADGSYRIDLSAFNANAFKLKATGDAGSSVNVSMVYVYETENLSAQDVSGDAWDLGASEVRCGNIKSVGALCLKPTIYTDTFTVADADVSCVCNKGTAMTANLPAATGSGRILIIKNIGAGEVTVDGDGSETIDGETTQTLYQYEVMRIQDIASGVWVVI